MQQYGYQDASRTGQQPYGGRSGEQKFQKQDTTASGSNSQQAPGQSAHPQAPAAAAGMVCISCF